VERSGPNLQVFWNVPTFMCHQYGLDFSEVQTRWGIMQNTRDVFRGEDIAILYDPGEFPALLYDKRGQVQFRNGGVPQEGNLTQHLSNLKEHIDQLVPDRNFNGLGVIDFEAWRPIFRQNWASLSPYRDVSKKIERERQPLWWTSAQIEAEAKRRFETAAIDFMLLTLELVKQMRPYGQWGYYAFPYCFNFTPNNMKPNCSVEVQHENNKIQWLFDNSVAIFPSLYLSKLQMSPEQRVQFMKGRMNEAVRVAQNVQRVTKPTVNAYVWYRYHDVNEFLSQEDLRNSLAIVHQYNGAVILWGSSNDTNSKEKCSALKHYLNTVLGPAIKELSTGNPNSFDLPSDPDTLL